MTPEPLDLLMRESVAGDMECQDFQFLNSTLAQQICASVREASIEREGARHRLLRPNS